MKIAVEGCAHGELEKIYECLEIKQRAENIKIDLLICCGDFQSVRNNDDLRAMAVPEKYYNICSFYKYYSGEKVAPVLTLFIGGNHEASNYLQELPYGGWVAPNIYYMGRAGVVRFGDIRIGGLSGIYKGRDYWQGLWEAPPYNNNSLRTVYHIRALDVFRLRQLRPEIHVMLSHDWPRGITAYGDVQGLLKRKPFFRDDIESNQLGSIPSEELLKHLKPQYWFSAHLHCLFSAVVPHDDKSETKFLALDKCLPRRNHLQLVDIPGLDGDKTLKYDPEWLAILKSTNHLLTVKNVDTYLPGPGSNERYNFTPSPEEINEIILLMEEDFTIKPEQFVRTAPVYNPGSRKGFQQHPKLNPQTVKLCEALKIDDPLQVVLARTGKKLIEYNDAATSKNALHESKTPVKVRMSLPAPITPSNADNNGTADSEVSALSDVPSTFISDTDNTLDTSGQSGDFFIDRTPDSGINKHELSAPAYIPFKVSGCSTPKSDGKKTFKRRNYSMYNVDNDNSGDQDNSVSSLGHTQDAPKPGKQAFRQNIDLNSSQNSDPC